MNEKITLEIGSEGSARWGSGRLCQTVLSEFAGFWEVTNYAVQKRTDIYHTELWG